jgi:hypothetical protein
MYLQVEGNWKHSKSDPYSTSKEGRYVDPGKFSELYFFAV